jgi:hypothetical protein
MTEAPAVRQAVAAGLLSGDCRRAIVAVGRAS